jgi:hypothetical protein
MPDKKYQPGGFKRWVNWIQVAQPHLGSLSRLGLCGCGGGCGGGLGIGCGGGGGGLI